MSGAACPDFDRLLRFLEVHSPGDDETIVAHVEGCDECRAELDRLAAATPSMAVRRNASQVCASTRSRTSAMASSSSSRS